MSIKVKAYEVFEINPNVLARKNERFARLRKNIEEYIHVQKQLVDSNFFDASRAGHYAKYEFLINGKPADFIQLLEDLSYYQNNEDYIYLEILRGYSRWKMGETLKETLDDFQKFLTEFSRRYQKNFKLRTFDPIPNPKIWEKEIVYTVGLSTTYLYGNQVNFQQMKKLQDELSFKVSSYYSIFDFTNM